MNTADKPCVLLVDDNKNVLTTLGDYLEFSGYEVLRASSGENALITLTRKTPDIMVLDIGMPGMGGLGLLKEISRDNGIPICPVLVLTAKTGMAGFFGELAVDGFLAKPCPEHTILEKIREILAKRQAGAESTPKRVLIVEDDVSAISRFREVFEEGGFAVDVVVNGAEAMVRAALTQPDAVIINEVLNGMRGSEVSSLLSALPSTRNLPVVLYDQSHRVDGHQPPHHLVAGRKELFVPTTTPEVIRKAVEKLLGA